MGGEVEGPHMIRRFVHETHGQGLVEYALIGSLIAVVAAVGLGLVAPKAVDLYQAVADTFPG